VTALRPDGKPMTTDDIRELHAETASFDNIEKCKMVTLPAAFKRKSFPPQLALFSAYSMTAVQIEWCSVAGIG
jgi:hypothetical protein